MKRWTLAISIALALVLLAGTGGLAQTPTPVAKIEGSISAVDVPGNKVTITPEAGSAVTLNVTDKTEIGVPGKEPATLADLKAGQPVKAKYETATSAALEIEVKEAKPSNVQGQITALDPAARKVTITPKEGQPVVLAITDKTKLEVWGKELAAFSDLKMGEVVRAEYNPTTLEALEMEVKGKPESLLSPKQGFFGTVKAKTDTSLTLDTKRGEVVLTLDGDTQYWNPPQKGATLTEVKVGDRVAVLALKQDSTLLARRVLIIPPKPVRLQVTGTVSQIEGNTITLTDKDGNTYKAELPQGLVSKIEVGDLVTLTLLKTPGVEKFVAGGMMGGKEMQERHLRSLDKVKAKRAETEAEQGKKAQELEKLDGLIQKNMEQQQEMMKKVMEKAPPQARKAIEKAMENSRRGWEQAKEALKKEKKEKEKEKERGKGKKS